MRLKEMATSWQGWRKWPWLGETGGSVHVLVRLEEMTMPGQGWRTWPRPLARLEEKAMPDPCRYFFKVDLFLQWGTLFLGFAAIAYHL